MGGGGGGVPGFRRGACGRASAATADGRRSATVQVSTRLGPGFGSQPVFRALRRTFGLAVCAAMAG
jgi:hypothetical protein